jgi:hypothetical protein
MYEDSHGNMQQFKLYDNISEFIHTFEEAKKNKKKIKDEKILEQIEELEKLEKLGDTDEPTET